MACFCLSDTLKTKNLHKAGFSYVSCVGIIGVYLAVQQTLIWGDCQPQYPPFDHL